MEPDKKRQRYWRIIDQLQELLVHKPNPEACMATINAVLHNKMKQFFWTGFYLLDKGELMVGPYQGSLACIKLEKNKGVCWAGINKGETVIVPDVHKFPGHIACDSRSNSEIVIPLRNKKNAIVGVLYIDSRDFNAFDEVDAEELERIIDLINW